MEDLAKEQENEWKDVQQPHNRACMHAMLRPGGCGCGFLVARLGEGRTVIALGAGECRRGTGPWLIGDLGLQGCGSDGVLD